MTGGIPYLQVNCKDYLRSTIAETRAAVRLHRIETLILNPKAVLGYKEWI